LHKGLAVETHLADGEFLQVAVNREKFLNNNTNIIIIIIVIVTINEPVFSWQYYPFNPGLSGW
jgi:hypothetical protein